MNQASSMEKSVGSPTRRRWARQGKREKRTEITSSSPRQQMLHLRAHEATGPQTVLLGIQQCAGPTADHVMVQLLSYCANGRYATPPSIAHYTSGTRSGSTEAWRRLCLQTVRGRTWNTSARAEEQ